MSNVNRNGVCNFFAQGKPCRFGKKCKFTHENRPGSFNSSPNESSRRKSTGQKPKREQTALEGTRRAWSYGLHGSSALVPSIVQSTIERALEMVDSGESGVKQDVIKDLGDEKGLNWIRQIVESHFADSESRYELSFITHCVPFLQLITHDDILSSLVLEKAVGTIYNVIYGPSGRRGIQFMQKVAEHVRILSTAASNGPEDENFGKAIAASTRALLQILELNQEGMVKSEFKAITTTFTTCLEGRDPADYNFRIAAKNIRRIKERLEMGDSLPAVRHYAPIVPMPDFQINVDLPGSLSTKGPRHGNDHTRIEAISILPTTSEMQSTRTEFLPLKDRRAKHHEDGIGRLLDSQFRLLREDTAGQLRDAVCALVAKWDVLISGTNTAKRKQSLRQINAKLNIFERVHIERMKYDRRKGMLIDLSFSQPAQLTNPKKPADQRKRRDYWKDSRDLQRGSLVALVDTNLETTFLLVADRPENPVGGRKNEGEEPVTGIWDLVSNSKRAMISLNLVDPTSSLDQARITKLAQEFWPEGAILVEFPGLLFASFEPVLKCLQQLHRNPTLPFGQWLVPAPDFAYQALDGVLKVPPPLYMTKRGVEINLSCIAKDRHRLVHSADKPVQIKDLMEHTTLDYGQCQGLLLSLQSELALVQGPPGTGKSYVGLQIAKVLLQNGKKLKLGPIICVCYTNHALDQMLEHILDSGERNIIRLGSRSQSEKVQECTLYERRKGMMRTRTENHNIWQCNQQIDEIQEEMDSILPHISRPFSPKDISYYLQTSQPRIHAELFGTKEADNEGFRQVAEKLSAKQALYRWTSGQGRPGRIHRTSNTDRAVPEIEQYLHRGSSVWNLSAKERQRLEAHWRDTIVNERAEDLRELLQKYEAADKDLQLQYKETDKRVLEEAGVIGVTTTGLAANSELLRSLPAKVLLIEEAAEVLEAHTITAFLPSVEHAILIGDHLQLRAQISKYELSMESERGKRYGLDESLFERLANERYGEAQAKMPVAKLNIQRRMHPSISSLVRNTLYPDLQDHDDTLARPEVPGLRRRLFWLDHQHHEDSVSSNEPNQTSKSNEWEAEMVLALVQHLSRQGVYGKGDIAVLTPYLGQLRTLKKKFSAVTELVIGEKDMENIQLAEEDEEEETVVQPPGGQVVRRGKLMEGLRLATVDNFQGEEAKVIVISLVRSNPDKQCGFLKTFNRINVLLSRARDGMYIIGDGQTSCHVKMWSDVIKLLERENNMSTQLELKCPRHPATVIAVSEPDDFKQFAPEGGCAEQCGRRLGCGHTCTFKCHIEALHNAVKCREDCPRQFKGCEHTCPKRCWENCGKCRTSVTTNITLPCGHTPSSLLCYESQNLDKVECGVKVTRTLPNCKHVVELRCHTDVKTHQCRQKCGDILPCGHACQKPCCECRKPDAENPGEITVSHAPCRSPCGKSFKLCSHLCKIPCHPDTACKPCDAPCEMRCAHSRCSRKCSEPCPPCAEQCNWSCPHRGTCNMPCGVPCDMVPCKAVRCEKPLECGHQCPSICGEECPTSTHCQQCAPEAVLDRVVDYIMYSPYRDADLNSDPVIVLSCGHLFTVESLDGHVDLKSYYHIDDTGEILGPKPVQEPKLKGCPDCRAPMLNIHRYNRAVKAALLDESTRRFIASSTKMLTTTTTKVEGWETNLEQHVNDFKAQKSGGFVSQTGALNAYRNKSDNYVRQMNSYLRSVELQEQPYGRVQSMVVNAKRRHDISSQFEIDKSALQHGSYLRGRCLRLRLLFAVLWNYKELAKEFDDEAANNLWETDMLKRMALALEECKSLDHDARAQIYPKESIEARVYSVQFTAIFLQWSKFGADEEGGRAAYVEETKRQAHAILDQCRTEVPDSARYIENHIDNAEKLIRGAVFYEFVTPAEWREVMQGMAREFSGSGHWYNCENGHPFTVGECGGPMEQTRCPECGAPVGGQHHMAAAGVRGADDLVRRLAAMGV